MKSPIIPVTISWICIVCATVLVMQSCKGEVATRYHPKLEGNLMANSYAFSQLNYTCASWDYPLGAILCVTNKENGRYVIVQNTDRHDYKTDLDLSFIAWTELRDWDWNDSGNMDVMVEEVSD